MTCGCFPYVSCYHVDDFERTETDGWGVASSGLATWYKSPTFGSGAHTSVSSGRAVFTRDVLGGGGYMYTSDGGPWTNTEWHLFCQIELENEALGMTLAIEPGAGGSIGFFLSGTAFTIATLDSGTDTIAHTLGATLYNVELHYQQGIVLEGRMWEDESAKPDAYQVFGLPSYDTDASANIIASEPSRSASAGGYGLYDLSFCLNGGPDANQPVQDEIIGIGDGSRTMFYTKWPYTPGSMEIDVDGVGAEYDPTSWRSGTVTMTTAPGADTIVTATYLRAP